MAGLTSQGFQSATLEEIKAQIEADLRAKISPNLDLSSESPTGQLVGIMAGQFRKLWELAEAVYNAQYPDTASGFSLVSLAALTGTPQEGAKPSVALCDVNVDPGTYAIGTLHAAVNGDPTALFSNALAVVNAGGSPTTITGCRFESESTGPVRANAGTLTVKAQAVTGWNSITNPADAVLGSDVESDADLRQRREDDLAKRGSSTAEAVRADILAVADVISATVLENDGDTTTVDGIPPHAMEAIVRGGTDADVAAAILGTKPVGIKAHGSTVVSVTDSQGNPQSIGLTRPATINVYIVASLSKGAVYPGDTAAKQTVADWGDANLVEGSDVVYARVMALFMDIPGVDDVLSLTIGTAPAPVGTVNLPISTRQIADLDTARISIT